MKRTKIGQKFYNVTIRAGMKLIKHPHLAQFLCLTWGLLGTIIGLLLTAVVCFIPHKKFGRFNGFPYFLFGHNWGGLEATIFFFVSDDMGEPHTNYVKRHETGHAFQNAIWGPLCPFIIFFPSIIRYWVIRLSKKSVDYDAIWFEGSATDLGTLWDKKVAQGK